MIQVATQISAVVWGIKIYPNLEYEDLKKLATLLKSFHKCDEICLNTSLIFGGQSEKCWAFPFIFDNEDSPVFHEYEEFQDLAEQMLILESDGRITESMLVDD